MVSSFLCFLFLGNVINVPFSLFFRNSFLNSSWTALGRLLRRNGRGKLSLVERSNIRPITKRTQIRKITSDLVPIWRIFSNSEFFFRLLVIFNFVFFFEEFFFKIFFFKIFFKDFFLT